MSGVTSEAIALVRASRPITLLRGPTHVTNNSEIEIDITFECNLKCENCDRSCSQAPNDGRMEVDRIIKFIEESKAIGKNRRKISILGGEPMIHPQIPEILDLFLEFKEKHSPGTMLEVATNGYGRHVKEAIELIPRDFFVRNSAKTSPRQESFEPFNVAPRDRLRNRFSDYSNACHITSCPGMGMNRYGFYQCGVAGGIDRVMGFDIGLKRIPGDAERFILLKRRLCAFCGHFNNLGTNVSELDGRTSTRSWAKAYKDYANVPPKLTVY